MKKLIIIAFLAVLLASISAVYATKPEAFLPLYISLEVESFDSNTNQVDIRVDFSIPKDSVSYTCSNFETEVLQAENLVVINDINWILDFSSDAQVTKHVFLQLDSGKIGQLMVDFHCPEKGSGRTLYRCFTIRDTLAMWTGFPYHLVKEASSKVDWDTLSAEELAKAYEIRILLRKDSDKEKARLYFGRIPEIDKDGYATMTMSLKECIKMDRETNLESYFLNPAEWMPTVDSPNHPKRKKKTE